MTRKKLVVVCLLILVNQALFAQTRKQKSITLQDQLLNLLDFSRLPQYQPEATAGQVSTYDTTGGNEDGFNGVYSFLRRNPDSSLVIFDMDGPGLINRIWTPTPSLDTFDFYIDDTLHPAFSINYMDLFSGKVAPFVKPICGNQLGGYFCYFPILFQKHGKIVCRAKSTQFHQIQYRRFPPGTLVESYSSAQLPAISPLLQKIATAWQMRLAQPNKTSSRQLSQSFLLLPGQTKSIASVDSAGRITSIQLSPAAAFEGLTKDIDIRITWDNDRTPAIDCPVADFFGYAFGRPSMHSILLGSDTNTLYSLFPMPFDKKASIELIYRKRANATQRPLALSSSITVLRQPRDSAHEGRFYTQWRQAQATEHKPIDILDTKGRGHYVGTILQAQGIQAGITIFFEGDDSTVIDGRMALHGTGSEDYFNGGWYALKDRWDAALSLPTHGCLDYSTVFGRTGGYRFYINDKLPFTKGIYHTIEHGPSNNETPAIYTTIGCYYGDRPPTQITEPRNENTKVFVPDTLILLPQFTHFSPGVDVSATVVWDSTYESGLPLELQIDYPGDLTFYPEHIPAGTYQLLADYLSQPTGVDVSAWQRQTQLSDFRSTAAPKRFWTTAQNIGEINIGPQTASITLQLKGDSTHKNFRLGRLLLVRK